MPVTSLKLFPCWSEEQGSADPRQTNWHHAEAAGTSDRVRVRLRNFPRRRCERLDLQRVAAARRAVPNFTDTTPGYFWAPVEMQKL